MYYHIFTKTQTYLYWRKIILKTSVRVTLCDFKWNYPKHIAINQTCAKAFDDAIECSAFNSFGSMNDSLSANICGIVFLYVLKHLSCSADK